MERAPVRTAQLAPSIVGGAHVSGVAGERRRRCQPTPAGARGKLIRRRLSLPTTSDGGKNRALPLRVLHVTSGLGVGGAELMLERLVATANRSAIDSAIISLSGPSEIGDRIAKTGIPVWSARSGPGGSALRAPLSLRSAAAAWRPDVIQGWMYHGNLAASVLSRTLGHRRPPVVWTIRQSLYDLKKEKPLTRIVIRAGRVISGTPVLTIYNSREAAASHTNLGFSPLHQIVIPNGFDCGRFVPD